MRARDGRIGTVSDFLFDDATWRVRWIVVHTGSSLAGRTALVRPLVFERVDRDKRELSVQLTMAEVDTCPDILLDEPVSRQVEYGERGYPDWNSSSGNFRYVAGPWGGLGVQVSQARLDEEKSFPRPLGDHHQGGPGDPHLRSIAAIMGNRVQATDGLIGRVRDVMFESADWNIHTFVTDASPSWPGRWWPGRWWPGERLGLPPAVIRSISWPHQEVRLNVSRSQARTTPGPKPVDAGQI